MNTTTHTITALKREVLGRKVKQLRKEGSLPANMYGKAFASIPVTFNARELNKVFDEAGQSSLVNVTVDKETYPVLFKNPVFHPLTSELVHIDLYKVNLKEKIKAEIPVELVGEAPAVKQGLEIMSITDSIEVECLPTDLPEKLEVEVSGLVAVDDMITVAGLKLPKGVEVLTDAETVLVKVAEHKEEVIEETPVVAPGEVPATEQKAPGEEEETKAEGKKEEK